MAFSFGTSYPATNKTVKGPPSRKSLLIEAPEERYGGMVENSPFAAGAKVPPVPVATTPTPSATAPVAPVAPPPIAQPPGAAAPPGAPDWFQEFIAKFFGPAIQQQNQNQATAQQGFNQFRNDAVFGRHLDMGGQPIRGDAATPLTFDSLRVPLADRIAKEQATFGASFTGGDRAPLTSTAWANQQGMAPQQGFGATQREQGMRPPQNAEASWGSPVYRAQHPEYNMFQQQASSTQPVDYPFIQQGRMMQRRMF